VSNRAWVGKEFFALDKTAQKGLLSTGNMLFCRTEPADKQRLVKMLQEVCVNINSCYYCYSIAITVVYSARRVVAPLLV
jgi:hypothetical protein